MIECAFTARIGRDPEFRRVKGGELALLSFSAVVDPDPKAQEATPTWLKVATFGERAEELEGRLHKGTRVYVEGRLTAELWLPEDGRQPRVNLNVVATLVQPLGQIGRRRPRPQQQPARRSYRNAIAAQAPFDDALDDLGR